MKVVHGLALVLLLLAAGCASPGLHGADERQRRFTAHEIAEVLRAEGYGSVERIDAENLRFKASGMTYLLTLYADGDLQLYFGLTGIAVGPEVVNEWNRTKRLSRAYLDADQDPVLEADLLAEAGLTRTTLVRWVQVFVHGAGLYHAFLLEHGTLEPLPAAQSPASI